MGWISKNCTVQWDGKMVELLEGNGRVWEYTALEEIVGGVFDTTSSNTGVHEGGMAHIEHTPKKCQMWKGCKHHTR